MEIDVIFWVGFEIIILIIILVHYYPFLLLPFVLVIVTPIILVLSVLQKKPLPYLYKQFLNGWKKFSS